MVMRSLLAGESYLEWKPNAQLPGAYFNRTITVWGHRIETSLEVLKLSYLLARKPEYCAGASVEKLAETVQEQLFAMTAEEGPPEAFEWRARKLVKERDDLYAVIVRQFRALAALDQLYIAV